MAYFLVLQNTYSHVEVALGREGTLVRQTTLSKNEASSHITLAIQTLLKEEHTSLDKLLFLAAHVGPAPFTTLRVVIATLNGLGFAEQKPLIAIDGLSTFLDEYPSIDGKTTVALFNAFNQDVYFGIDSINREIGCTKIGELISILQNQYAHHHFYFIGSGVITYKEQLGSLPKITIPTPLPEQISLTYLVQKAWQQWQDQQNVTIQLQPLYLKKAI
jgi:tRNA threonylcarbamoyl adenosine modification protein YeaZ